MSGVADRDRMNSLFQEMKSHGLTEPVPGVNEARDLTLTWMCGDAEVVIVISDSIYLVADAPGKENTTLELDRYNDSEIVEIIQRFRLIEKAEESSNALA